MHALESSFAEKGLHVLMNNKPDTRQQYAPVAKAADQIWVYINKTAGCRSGEAVLPLCSAPARPQPSTAYSLWL